jgi:hypothetical protein
MAPQLDPNVMGMAMNLAGALGRVSQRQSLTRMARDSIMQFPVLISNSIENDTVGVIAKSLERLYATFMASAISLRGTVRTADIPNAAAFLKQFHSNDNNNMEIEAIKSVVLESFNPSLKPLGIRCWDIEDSVATESLNDIYLPFEKTVGEFNRRMDMAMESKTPAQDYRDAAERRAIRDAQIREEDNDRKNRELQLHEEENRRKNWADDRAHKDDARKDRDEGRRDRDLHVKERDSLFKENEDKRKTRAAQLMIHGTDTKAPVMANKKLAEMEPTMMNLGIVFQGDGEKHIQNVTIGIKAMVRLIQSDVMVANMCAAAQRTNAIFNFIKKTKGESNFIDFLTGYKNAREKANQKRGAGKWFSALLRRRTSSAVKRAANSSSPLMPTTTLIITSFEAQDIYDKTGVNYNEEVNALKLIDKYFLLGFCVYNTEKEVFQYINDGEAEWTYMGLRNMVAENKTNAIDADIVRGLTTTRR